MKPFTREPHRFQITYVCSNCKRKVHVIYSKDYIRSKRELTCTAPEKIYLCLDCMKEYALQDVLESETHMTTEQAEKFYGF